MKNSEETNQAKSDLQARIKNAVNGLYYTSETDAEITSFTGKKTDTASAEEFLKQINPADNQPVKEKTFNDFFARLTEIQDWFGDEEKATAQKFTDLKDLLEKNLKDIKVFKIGKVEIDVFVVGIDAEGDLSGIQTKAVETGEG